MFDVVVQISLIDVPTFLSYLIHCYVLTGHKARKCNVRAITSAAADAAIYDRICVSSSNS